MIRRLFFAALFLLLAAIAIPPLWYGLFPVTPAELPTRGERVVLPSGAAVNVVAHGTGAPVVLVHGLPGSAYDWRLLADALAARGRRAIAYDRVGYGYSDARSGAATVAHNSEDLLGLLDALDLHGATVVGWSYGGPVTLGAAQEDAKRIARVVLVASAGPGGAPPPALAIRIAFSPPVLGWLHAVTPAGRALRRAMSSQAFSGQPQPDWWIPGLDGNFERPETARTFGAENIAFDWTALPDGAGLALPILIAHGDDDRLVPVAVGRELARRAPGAELRIVPGGSHMLPITHADWLAGEIVAFEERTPAR